MRLLGQEWLEPRAVIPGRGAAAVEVWPLPEGHLKAGSFSPAVLAGGRVLGGCSQQGAPSPFLPWSLCCALPGSVDRAPRPGIRPGAQTSPGLTPTCLSGFSASCGPRSPLRPPWLVGTRLCPQLPRPLKSA